MRNCLALTDRLRSSCRRSWVSAIQHQQQQLSRGFSNEKDHLKKTDNNLNILGGMTHNTVIGMLTASSTIMKDDNGNGKNGNSNNNQKNKDNKAGTSNVGPPSTQNNPSTSPPKQPRRRPRFGSNKGTKNSPPRQQQKQHQDHDLLLPPFAKYGTDVLNSQFEIPFITDSSAVPILIPGRPLQGAGSDNTANQNKNNANNKSNHKNKKQQPQKTLRRPRKQLPLVNAAALLDTDTYCKISVTPNTHKGQQKSKASMRLLRGKKDLVDMLRGHIIGTHQRPFCLTGHGVPRELLQEHLNFADVILKHYQEPAECTISNNSQMTTTTTGGHNQDHHFYGGIPGLEDNNDESSSSWGMTIRRQDGKSKFKALLPADNPEGYRRGISQEWAYQLGLYLAVMGRMTTKLGKAGSTYRDSSTPGTSTASSSKENHTPPTQWKVTIYRGMAFPMEVISREEDDTQADGPVPILEWSPHTNTKQQPQVSIRLQGIPKMEGNASTRGNKSNRAGTGSGKRHAVTLVYTASFPGN